MSDPKFPELMPAPSAFEKCGRHFINIDYVASISYLEGAKRYVVTSSGSDAHVELSPADAAPLLKRLGITIEVEKTAESE